MKKSCPLVCFSDCNHTNSTPWILQSKNGMASEDQLSQSTVCYGIHGDYYSCVTFDNLTEDNEVYFVYTTHFTVGEISLNIHFFSRNQTRQLAGQCQDSNKMVLEMYGDRENIHNS
jgi:hypothetical protein